MAEVVQEQNLLPRISSTGEAVSCIVKNMSDMMTDFIQSLQPEERNKFRLIEDLNKKIDIICWEWGQVPEKTDSADDLKSLQAIRILEDTVVSEDVSATRDFPMYIGDPFWGRVDKRIYDHLNVFVTQETGATLPPYESLGCGTTIDLFELDTYTISRTAVQHSGMVTYSATPTNTQSY